ncbi:MAG: DUF423 domain-containing protein [Verrucomicrobiota bacterium]|nr:DUF423 domain-containing protein [Verrucomicrobiota bacterium]
MSQRILLILAGLSGFTGVLLGAFGAHALKATLLQNGHYDTWDTAVKYHLIHAVAAYAVALCSTNSKPTHLLRYAVMLWLLGILLFSGSLYLLSFGGNTWLGPITPLGGLLLLTGWFLTVLHSLKAAKE